MIQTASAPATAQITKQPACPVCLHSDTTRFAFERHGDFIYSCGSCSLEFQFPQPSEEKLASIYSGDYFLGSTNAEALENQRALKRATAVLYLDVLASFLKRNARLLEIGCGHGEFLLEAQCRGYAVEGLEYSQHATAEANSQLGRNAVRVRSPEMDFLGPASYSLIASFHGLEH